GPDPKGASPIRVSIVNIGEKSKRDLPMLKIRSAGVQLAYQPTDFLRAALSTYRAVFLGDIDGLNLQTPEIQPICFRGTFATPLFSSDGRKLLTLSGDAWPFFATIQLWDVSLRGVAQTDPNFEPEGEAGPPWLSEMARSNAGSVGPTEDANGAFTTARKVWEKF